MTVDQPITCRHCGRVVYQLYGPHDVWRVDIRGIGERLLHSGLCSGRPVRPVPAGQR